MKKINLYLIVGTIFAAGILFGLIIGRKTANKNSSQLYALRLGGYKYINPLLTCDTEEDQKSDAVASLESQARDFIEGQKRDGKINSASVYFRNFVTGDNFNISPDDKFAPASLNKIPVMMTFYKIAKNDPSILTKQVRVSLSQDANIGQEIKPSQSAKIGKTYTIDQLIGFMIKYSDNNSFYTLTAEIAKMDKQLLNTTYTDLKISLPQNVQKTPDFMTAKDFSYFLRVLYNGTYLNKKFSERALGLLSHVDFQDGLRSDIPEATEISHKFGLQIIPQNHEIELHDCGIAYRKSEPYLLCVMTKGTSQLKNNQDVIKGLSSLVYKNLK